MKKVTSALVPRVWGKEIWLWSTLPAVKTPLEDGTLPKNGPLVKILVAKEPLPVQVHPDDALAKKLENQPEGKNESWYILKTTSANDTMVVGLKDYSADKIRQMVAAGTFEQNLVTVRVKPGEFYYAPAGMVHSMGGGITALEVQQQCDITYRYYDYGRLVDGKPRAMQVEKALICQKPNTFMPYAPSQLNPLTYPTGFGRQFFPKGPLVTENEGLVVDLDSWQGYYAQKGEKIDLPHFAFIEFPHGGKSVR